MATTKTPTTKASSRSTAKTGAATRAAVKKTASRPAADSTAAKRPVARKSASKVAAKATKAPASPRAAGKARSASSPAAASTVKPRASAATATSRKPAKPVKSAARSVAKTDIVELLRDEVVKALEGLKAHDISEIDVRGKTSIADYMFVASGTSTRHVKSIADEVVKFSKKTGVMPLGVEGQREGEWVLVDLGDIIVHVMLPRVREFYGIERLWTVGEEMRDAVHA